MSAPIRVVFCRDDNVLQLSEEAKLVLLSKGFTDDDIEDIQWGGSSGAHLRADARLVGTFLEFKREGRPFLAYDRTADLHELKGNTFRIAWVDNGARQFEYVQEPSDLTWTTVF